MHSDKHTAGCTHVGIAHNSVGDVSVCHECSIVHLTLSHMTIRLTPEAFRSMASLVALSQKRLDQGQQSVSASAAHAAPTVSASTPSEPAPFPPITTPQRLH